MTDKLTQTYSEWAIATLNSKLTGNVSSDENAYLAPSWRAVNRITAADCQVLARRRRTHISPSRIHSFARLRQPGSDGCQPVRRAQDLPRKIRACPPSHAPMPFPSGLVDAAFSPVRRLHGVSDFWSSTHRSSGASRTPTLQIRSAALVPADAMAAHRP